jgi:hypothetical protein
VLRLERRIRRRFSGLTLDAVRALIAKRAPGPNDRDPVTNALADLIKRERKRTI